MPFAGYKDFDACVIDQTKKGYSQGSATRICGAIKARVEGASEDEANLSKEELQTVDDHMQLSEDVINGLFEYLSDITVKGKESVIEVLRVGTLKSRGLTITMPMLKEFIANWKDGAYGVDLQVNLGHNRDGEAAGWFKDLFLRGQKLMAKIEWTPLGEEKLKNKQFRFFSAEFAQKWFDDVSNKIFNNVLIGGALTNIPAVKNINQGGIVLSESLKNQLFLTTNNSNMDAVKMYLEELKKKDVVLASEKSILKNMLTTLEEEQKEELAPDVQEVEAKPEEVKTEEKPAEPVEGKKEDSAELAEDSMMKKHIAECMAKGMTKEEAMADYKKMMEGKKLSEEVDVVKLQEELAAKDAELIKLREEKQAIVLKERINEVVLSEAGKPALRKDQAGLSEFISSLSDEQYSQFKVLLSSVVMVTPDMLKELGTDKGNETLSEGDEEEAKLKQVEALAEKYVTEEGMKKDAAVIRAQKEVFTK